MRLTAKTGKELMVGLVGAKLDDQVLQARVCKPLSQIATGSLVQGGIASGDGRFKRADLLWDDFLFVGSDSGRARDFHRKWGVLKICACGEHIYTCRMEKCRSQYLDEDGSLLPVFEEPYTRVTRLSTCFLSLLKLKASIVASEESGGRHVAVGSAEDWRNADFAYGQVKKVNLRGEEVSRDEEYEFLRYPAARRLMFAKSELSYQMFQLLSASKLSLAFSWTLNGPRMGIQDHSFFSVFPQLVMQLTTALTVARPMLFCSSCQKVYSPTRKPKPNSFHVCGDPLCMADQNRRNVEMHRRRRFADKA